MMHCFNTIFTFVFCALKIIEKIKDEIAICFETKHEN